jgi:hypothetical protein
VTDDGHWAVIQQGMDGERKRARRYHWLSENLKNFVEEPHAAIDGADQGQIVNLTDRRADGSRRKRDWLKIGGAWINRVKLGLFLDPEWKRGMDFTVGANWR